MTPTAEDELRSAFEYIHEQAPLNATRWLRDVLARVQTLESFPSGCAAALDSAYMGESLRHLILGSYRILFRIEEDARIARVLGVRHGAQRFLGQPDDPPESPEEET